MAKKIVMILCLVIQMTIFTTIVNASDSMSLLILGDSIARGYGLDNPSTDCYGAKLAESLGLDGSAYTNLAVDGSTSEDWVSSIKEQSTVDALASHNVIVISVGGNDLLSPFYSMAKEALGLRPNASDLEFKLAFVLHSNALELISAAMLENQERLVSSTDDFPENLREIVTAIKTVNPGAKLYIQTIYNPFSGVPGMEIFDTVADLVIGKMNTAIKKGASAYSVMDIYSAFKGNAALYTNIADFDIHPNAAGHEVIFERLYERISSVSISDMLSKVGDVTKWVFGVIGDIGNVIVGNSILIISFAFFITGVFVTLFARFLKRT